MSLIANFRHSKGLLPRMVLLLVFLATPCVLLAQSAPSPAGNWEGLVSVGDAKVRLIFHISALPDGTLKGAMDSPDQGAFGLAASSITCKDGSVAISIGQAGIRFEGRFEGSDRIVGTLSQGPHSDPLILSRQASGQPALAKRPQDPVPPFPYREIEVSYPGGSPDVTLAATLTIPPGSGPFPTVLLLTGSGKQDRDEAILGHHPFRVLADHLARNGIAVLRADDRGMGGSSAGSPDATTDDFGADAVAGLRFLQKRSEVDPARLGLLGHSEGGYSALCAIRQGAHPAFLVFLAGPAQSGGDLIVSQVEALVRASGAPAEAARMAASQQSEIIRLLKTTPDAERKDKIQQYLTGLGMPMERAKTQSASLCSPWYRFFIGFDPTPVLHSLQIPVLALFGERDTQVPAQANRTALEEALKGHVPTGTAIHVLPSLNHLFQECTTGLPTEYGGIQQTISPKALETISSWVRSLPASSSPR